MDLKDYEKLADEAHEMGIFVVITGEALLDKNLGDLISVLDPHNI